jgi:hypothetical protein
VRFPEMSAVGKSGPHPEDRVVDHPEPDTARPAWRQGGIQPSKASHHTGRSLAARIEGPLAGPPPAWASSFRWHHEGNDGGDVTSRQPPKCRFRIGVSFTLPQSTIRPSRDHGHLIDGSLSVDSGRVGWMAVTGALVDFAEILATKPATRSCILCRAENQRPLTKALRLPHHRHSALSHAYRLSPQAA